MRYDEKGEAFSRAQMAVAVPQGVAKKKMLAMLRSALTLRSMAELVSVAEVEDEVVEGG